MKRTPAGPSQHVILGVHITDRVLRADEVQRTLTAHGAVIRTRLGLHDAGNGRSSPNGLILLELAGDGRAATALTAALRRIRGVQVRRMTFGH